MRRLLIVLLFVPLALAQRHRLTTFSTETPEGALLQQIGQEPTEAKKLELIEQFVAKFPAHEATPWVLVQLQAGYMKSNQFDKALEAGRKAAENSIRWMPKWPTRTSRRPKPRRIRRW